MRLTSSRAVVNEAEAVVRNVIEAYAAPNRTFNDLRQRAKPKHASFTIRCVSSARLAEPNCLRYATHP